MKWYSILTLLILAATNLPAQETISRSFELRYYTVDPKADGETDFKGETEYFNTGQRVEYLNTYEQYARKFFENQDWDQLVITDDEAKEIAASIKPQPLPSVRKRMLLENWKCLGYKDGQHQERLDEIEKWNSLRHVTVDNESLLFEKDTEISIPIPEQSWRSLFRLSVNIPKGGTFSLKLGDALSVSHQDIPEGKWVPVSIEFDLENGRYNLYVDETKTVDFEPLDADKPVIKMSVATSKGVRIDDIHCVQYTRGKFTEDNLSRSVPFHVHTFLLEDFRLKPGINGWQTLAYDDALWERRNIPYPHGGERFKDESLYMRKTVNVPDFTVAELNFETIDPGGEIWVNGQVVHVQNNRYPVKVDIGEYLKPNHANLIGVRVYPNRVEHTFRCTPDDLYTGSFAGRGWIDFREDRFIDDVFVYTKSIGDKKATVGLEAELRNLEWEPETNREPKKWQLFKGTLKVDIYKWFPEESKSPVASQAYPVELRLHHDFKLEKDIVITSPELWSYKNPNLYRVTCVLEDEAGNKLDDYVITTGIRTIGQGGGTFRINGEAEMMNGALLFGFKYPIEDIARTIRCADDYWLVKEIEMIRRMNANAMRMSVHHGMKGGINDPRLAEIGDQLGVMFQWSTATWARTSSPWLVDFEALPKYVRQVRNHPSITMWQPANHPGFLSFNVDCLEWITRVYESIYPNDPSRLISPSPTYHHFFGKERLGIPNDEGTMSLRGDTLFEKTVWTAPMICRGNMDNATGYGAEWSVLRKYPYPPRYEGQMGSRFEDFRVEYINSKERAYFDFESEESTGQPNWNMRKGKPAYQIKSYELNYDDGSIGRKLSVDEWRTSQAWQGFSAYEAYRKKRWLDYDGMAWCCLHGGGNTATYQKPLIDYYGHSKIAYHTVKMVFQPVLAGSKNVDIVYSENDTIPIVIMNMGEKKRVGLKLTIKTPQGKVVDQIYYPGIMLEQGRTFTDIGNYKPNIKDDGYYIFEYEVQKY